MWANVEEKIQDGTSGLAASSGAPLVFLGVSSKGPINKPLILGKGSNIVSVLGYGELADTIEDCRRNMDDISIIAMRCEGDIPAELTVKALEASTEDLTILGEPLFSAEATVKVLNTEEVEVAYQGDKNGKEIVPVDQGTAVLVDCGLSLILPAKFTAGQGWALKMKASSCSLEALKKGLLAVTDIHTPELALVCRDSSAKDAEYWGECAERLFEDDHKPVHIILKTAWDMSKSFTEAVSDKAAEFGKTSARFVSVLCQPGKIVDGSLRHQRQPLGLLAASLSNAKVNQSIGATRYFPVGSFELPVGWTNAESRALDEARLITLRTYAGLNGLFWSNGRTLGGVSSDYRFIEVVRTVHKAIRIARKTALPYIQAPGDIEGVQNLLAELRSNIGIMTATLPVELLLVEIDAPSGQDIVNNGLNVNISLYGVPIIRKIVLNFMFKYKADL